MRPPMPLAFAVCSLVSTTGRSARGRAEQAAFDAPFVRARTGRGAEAASAC